MFKFILLVLGFLEYHTTFCLSIQFLRISRFSSLSYYLEHILYSLMISKKIYYCKKRLRQWEVNKTHNFY